MIKEAEYRSIAMELLEKYIKSETNVIGEFSVDFKKSAELLKKEVKKYLRKLDYNEDLFDLLVKGNWLFEDWEGDTE